MDLKFKKINFLGDSITEGVKTSGKDYRFTNIIERETGAVCRNYGIGGTRIARQSEISENPHLDLDFCRRFKGMDPIADVIVVFGGTNDFGHGKADLGTADDRTPYTFYGALHYLCLNLKKRYPYAKIVFITPIHRSIENVPHEKHGKEYLLADYVNAVREVTALYSLPLLDMFSHDDFDPKDPEFRAEYVPDGLHPNDAGHRILANEIIKFLKDL